MCCRRHRALLSPPGAGCRLATFFMEVFMGQKGKTGITQERIKYLFSYDETTGIFIRKNEGRQNAPIGEVAGHVNKLGYVILKVDGEAYKAHRLAWLYVYGKLPENEIDHINGNTGDNRITNLRDVSTRDNILNKRQYRENEVIRGATKNSRGKWTCTIRDGNIRRSLGQYNTPEEAQRVYDAAKVRVENGEKLLDILHEFCGRGDTRIKCVDTGQIFSTAKEAAEWARCAATNIIACCKGRCRTVKGYKWRYVKESPDE